MLDSLSSSFTSISFLLINQSINIVYRKCSCDAGELQMRADAGILSNARDLPVLSMTFLNGGRTNESGTITLGKLYCAQVEFGKL